MRQLFRALARGGDVRTFARNRAFSTVFSKVEGMHARLSGKE